MLGVGDGIDGCASSQTSGVKAHESMSLRRTTCPRPTACSDAASLRARLAEIELDLKRLNDLADDRAALEHVLLVLDELPQQGGCPSPSPP